MAGCGVRPTGGGGRGRMADARQGSSRPAPDGWRALFDPAGPGNDVRVVEPLGDVPAMNPDPRAGPPLDGGVDLRPRSAGVLDGA